VQVGVGVNVGVGVIVGVADAVAVGVGEGVRVAVAVAETDAAETAKFPGSPITSHPTNSSKSDAPRHHRHHPVSDMPLHLKRFNRVSVTRTASASMYSRKSISSHRGA